jgi:hypothetical protein
VANALLVELLDTSDEEEGHGRASGRPGRIHQANLATA